MSGLRDYGISEVLDKDIFEQKKDAVSFSILYNFVNTVYDDLDKIPIPESEDLPHLETMLISKQINSNVHDSGNFIIVVPGIYREIGNVGKVFMPGIYCKTGGEVARKLQTKEPTVYVLHSTEQVLEGEELSDFAGDPPKEIVQLTDTNKILFENNDDYKTLLVMLKRQEEKDRLDSKK